MTRALCIHFFGWTPTVRNCVRTKRILRALGKGVLWCVAFVALLAVVLIIIPLTLAL